MLTTRRSFLTGIGLMIAAPAVVRAESLMPVRAPKLIKPAGCRLYIGKACYGVPSEWIEIGTIEQLSLHQTPNGIRLDVSDTIDWEGIA